MVKEIAGIITGKWGVGCIQPALQHRPVGPVFQVQRDTPGDLPPKCIVVDENCGGVVLLVWMDMMIQIHTHPINTAAGCGIPCALDDFPAPERHRSGSLLYPKPQLLPGCLCNDWPK